MASVVVAGALDGGDRATLGEGAQHHLASFSVGLVPDQGADG
jgi:hypothetical protein